MARSLGVSPETIKLVGKVEEAAESGSDLAGPPKRCGVACVGLVLHSVGPGGYCPSPHFQFIILINLRHDMLLDNTFELCGFLSNNYTVDLLCGDRAALTPPYPVYVIYYIHSPRVWSCLLYYDAASSIHQAIALGAVGPCQCYHDG